MTPEAHKIALELVQTLRGVLILLFAKDDKEKQTRAAFLMGRDIDENKGE